MKKFIRSLGWARHGLRSVIKEERNFRIELMCAVAVLLLGIILDITRGEFALIFIAIALVLTAEVLNTAIEDLCDRVEPNLDPVIGKIKDIMAAYVLIAGIGASVIGLTVFLPYIF